MKIKDMPPNTKGRVTGFSSSDRAYRQKLLRMGLIKGAEFTLIRKAPLGDPVEIQLQGFNLTLRKKEAEALDVEPVGEE